MDRTIERDKVAKEVVHFLIGAYGEFNFSKIANITVAHANYLQTGDPSDMIIELLDVKQKLNDWLDVLYIKDSESNRTSD